MTANHSAGANVTTNEMLDRLADMPAISRGMRREDEHIARTCRYCGGPLADPDANRAIVVEHDGATTSAFHVDCGEPWEPYEWTGRCEHCSREMRFHGERGFRHRRYCSPICRKRADYDLRERVDRPLARTCPGCGQWFTPRRDDQRTCSARCRQRVHRHGEQHPVTFLQPEPFEPVPPSAADLHDLSIDDLDFDDLDLDDLDLDDLDPAQGPFPPTGAVQERRTPTTTTR